MLRALPPRLVAVLIMLFWLCVGVVSYVLGVRSEIGQRAEETVLDASRFSTDPPAPLGLVTPASVALAILILCVVALASHGVSRAVYIGVSATIAVVASQVLKGQMLTRPDFVAYDAPNTFPSGHMTAFAVVAIALVLAVPRQLRVLVTLIGAVVMSVAGCQLIFFGWHRPSDVFGGVALAVVVFAAGAALAPGGKLSGGGSHGQQAANAFVLIGWILAAVALGFVVAGAFTESSRNILIAGLAAATASAMLAGHSAITCARLLESSSRNVRTSVW